MTREKIVPLRSFFPDLSLSLDTTKYALYAVLSCQSHDFIFEVQKENIFCLELKLKEKDSSSITPYGKFSPFEVTEMLQDLFLKQSTVYLPKEFDNLKLDVYQLSKFRTVLNLFLCLKGN